MMDFLLLGGCFLFVLLAVVGGGYWFLREPEKAETEERKTILLDEEDGALKQTLEKIGRAVPSSVDAFQPLRKKLIAAGYRDPDAVYAFFGIKAVVAIVLGLLTLWLSLGLAMDLMTSLVAAVCGGGFGYLLPERFLRGMTKKRQLRLRQSLPSALDLLVLGLEAGQGLDITMLDTSRELRAIYPDLSDEFSLSHLEMRAGRSRAQVLQSLAERTGEPEMRKLTNLLLDGDRFGTSLGPALRNHARYLRTRRRQLSQEEARKTSVKLVFPVFFLIFPSVLVVTLGPAVLRLTEGMSKMLDQVR
jgi:tight adherence protein C